MATTRSNPGKGKKVKTKTKSIPLKVHFWRGEHGTGIHLAADLPTFTVIVRKDGSKQSGHPSLWRELDKCLRQQNRSTPSKKNSKQPLPHLKSDF